MGKNKKKILFVHQNFPGQYKHIVNALSIDNDKYDVHTLSIQKFEDKKTTNHHYNITSSNVMGVNQWAVEFETKMIRADACAKKSMQLKQNGFYPDLIIGHPGWGETFFLKEVWPNAKIISYAEFYYKTSDCDIDFDLDLLENILKKDFEEFHQFNQFKLNARNAPFTHIYSISDYLVCPTEFQKDLLPDIIKPNVKVIHDGIDTDYLKPIEDLSIKIGGTIFTKKNKLITYVSRSLDPYRGFHIFVNSIPKILKDNPEANILIVGNAETPGYGATPPGGKMYKEICYGPIEDEIDNSRVHFLGRVPYDSFVKIIQLSTIHVYLSYPFVLSWSMLEAMSCGALVIGSNTDPVTEVLHDEKNGLIVDFFDSDSIAEKVTQVLNNSNKYNDLRNNARKTIIDNYDLKTICLPRHLGLINEALK